MLCLLKGYVAFQSPNRDLGGYDLWPVTRFFKVRSADFKIDNVTFGNILFSRQVDPTKPRSHLQ